MARSLTSSDKSVSKLLSARDGRQDALAQALSQGVQSTIFLALNIPGPDKQLSGSHALFLWALAEVGQHFHELTRLESGSDALGDYAIVGVNQEPAAVKQQCMMLEAAQPAARLIDLDVYSANGKQVDRKSLGFSARPCLLCDEDAVECMRVQRHFPHEVIAKVHEFLAPFRP
ncbi:MAG: citrate lyase holo-[acyl-carrier protein] synthase [Betaproteobacteria bacterium]